MFTPCCSLRILWVTGRPLAPPSARPRFQAIRQPSLPRSFKLEPGKSFQHLLNLVLSRFHEERRKPKLAPIRLILPILTVVPQKGRHSALSAGLVSSEVPQHQKAIFSTCEQSSLKNTSKRHLFFKLSLREDLEESNPFFGLSDPGSGSLFLG